jgi:hypothetical protein
MRGSKSISKIDTEFKLFSSGLRPEERSYMIEVPEAKIYALHDSIIGFRSMVRFQSIIGFR